jgi:septal ring factor EnvC (AmiA/AmiB activator)
MVMIRQLTKKNQKTRKNLPELEQKNQKTRKNLPELEQKNQKTRKNLPELEQKKLFKLDIMKNQKINFSTYVLLI